MEFKEWPKIPRFRREVCITEKIDGTNACIAFDDEGNFAVQSRNRIITPEDDNYGFARWCHENIDELRKLGRGYHYGEWWGSKIGRNYGVTDGKRFFSLFNVGRPADTIPECCRLVPILARGLLGDAEVRAVATLRSEGSLASKAEGFPYMNPEGIIIWHSASREYYKQLLEGDELPKGVLEKNNKNEDRILGTAGVAHGAQAVAEVSQ